MEIPRELYYSWLKRETLEDRKPGPRHAPWALSDETVSKVLELKKQYEEIATCYVIAIKAGISPSSVGKIFREHAGQAKEKNPKKKCFKTVDWLKMHICWALDSLKIASNDGYVFAQLIFEEYSRSVLGWIASFSNTAEKAKMLFENVTEKFEIMPLIAKSDRGSEFQNSTVKGYLDENGILPMPSPGNYPLFNGKLERENSIIRKFLKPKKGGYSAEEICARIEKAVYVINHELPRRIFGGKTSAEVFKNGEIYKKEEKEMLIKKAEEEIAKIEKQRIPGVDQLDVIRKGMVKSVVDMGLCVIKSGGKNVNQFAG